MSAPWRVRLPPQTLRVTTAGRIACSASSDRRQTPAATMRRDSSGPRRAARLVGGRRPVRSRNASDSSSTARSPSATLAHSACRHGYSVEHEALGLGERFLRPEPASRPGVPRRRWSAAQATPASTRPGAGRLAAAELSFLGLVIVGILGTHGGCWRALDRFALREVDLPRARPGREGFVQRSVDVQGLGEGGWPGWSCGRRRRP